MVVFNKCFSEVGRDLEFYILIFFSVSSQNGHFSIPRKREKYLKHYVHILHSPLERTINSYISFCSLSHHGKDRQTA